jgi:hypothetical protein
MSPKITEYRNLLSQIREQLIDAEATLADRLAEVNAFEVLFEARVGHLLDRLEALEQEIQGYHDRIQLARNKQLYGNAHLPVERQYQRTWQSPPRPAPIPPPEPLQPDHEAEIRRLYRQLARRFHPDLAPNDAVRANYTQKMAAINEAYAARSLVELVALAQEAKTILTGPDQPPLSEAQLIAALEGELVRCRRRLTEIEREIRAIPQRPSVAVSLEVTAARRQGRDLLAEMAAELNQKIARKQVEADMLKAQFDQLGPDQGYIPLKR